MKDAHQTEQMMVFLGDIRAEHRASLAARVQGLEEVSRLIVMSPV